MNLINFDHNATTPLSQASLKRMIEVYNLCANSSSVHQNGRLAAAIIEEARQDLINVLNAKNYEVFFTSSGTEANNMALFSHNFKAIFYSAIEHSSVFNVRPQGVEIVDLKADENGVINLENLQNLLAKKELGANFLTAMMLANNETGAIQDVKKAAKIVHQNGGLIHSDLTQAFGKITIDLEDLNVDFASVSAHKINGPQGVGALLVRKGIDINPLIFGGKQEKGKRSGTLSHALIAGFGEAIKLVPSRIEKMHQTAKIRDFIETTIKNIAKENVEIFSQNAARLDNTSFIAMRNQDAQTQLIHFDLNNILVSSGAACSSGTVLQSRVLQAINAKKDFLQAIRISLAPENTMLEAERFCALWQEFYLRNLNL